MKDTVHNHANENERCLAQLAAEEMLTILQSFMFLEHGHKKAWRAPGIDHVIK